jgi:hypothetical protein
MDPSEQAVVGGLWVESLVNLVHPGKDEACHLHLLAGIVEASERERDGLYSRIRVSLCSVRSRPI